MKKLLTLALLILACSTQAQIPDYFAGNPEWRQELTWGGAMPCLEIDNYVYYLNGDSVVDGYIYKKVYKRGEHDHSWMGDPPAPDYCTGSSFYNYFYGLVRQDSLKVYIREGNNDYLLYDFDLSVGDTLPETYFLMENNVVVSSIDSILVGGSYRKIFNLENSIYPYPLDLIEGIGFNQGFLDEVPDWYPAQLLCFVLDDTTYYPSYGEPCDLMIVDISNPEVQYPGLKIFPNPSAGNISIKFNSGPNTMVNVKVSDISGRNLRDEIWAIDQGMNVKSLDLGSFDKGVYFISIIGKDNETLGRQTIVLN
ncbi:MAG: hypothetical protein B6I19_06585 [Bacteroidetes bacterium 4572_114]|nr:MAG: hypothetical protein B6I19_06585 [Bacteroidetes bacterium 4572_114]